MTTKRTERCHWLCIGKPDGEHSTSCPKSFTAPTKRAHVPCTCGQRHADPDVSCAPECASLHPAQHEPDVLTRLKRTIRAMGAPGLSASSLEHLEHEALALISEAREEQMKQQKKQERERAIDADVAYVEVFKIWGDAVRAKQVADAVMKDPEP